VPGRGTRQIFNKLRSDFARAGDRQASLTPDFVRQH
jgi:hypothetical protein